MRLAICMIVKNEEACLEKCLDSVKGLGEIFILDTGSTDKTVEIARKYTDKIFEDYKWNDDFAEARNHILAKCDADWILSIDADETLNARYVDVINTIVDADKRGLKTVDVILRANMSPTEHYFPRIFKQGVHWKGAVHNYLDAADNNQSKIVIVYGYSEAHKQDPDRSFRILTREAAKPGAKRDIYYLAREYWYRNKYQEAIDLYKKYITVGNWVPELADAYVMIAKCYIKLGKYRPARQYAALAIDLNADFAEALHIMGDLTGPKNSAKWYKWEYEATNKDVLFIHDMRSKRDVQLINCVPDIFKFKSVLYVGANQSRQQVLKDFRNHGYKIDIVEPCKANADFCKFIVGVDNVFNTTIQAFQTEKHYDVVFWWHGPEHIKDEEIETTFKNIESMANKYVVLGCPWGVYEQGAVDGNEFEVHTRHWLPEEFSLLGYKTNTIGSQDKPNDSNIIAWKNMEA